MRVLTHNLLCCLKCDHYPLAIHATEKVEEPEEQDVEFVLHMLPRLEYAALLSAANDLGIQGLPDQLPDNVRESPQALAALHKLLMCVHVKEGSLLCKECGRAYPIMTNGIPNMLLRDDEVAQKKKSAKEKKREQRRRERPRRMRGDADNDEEEDNDEDEDASMEQDDDISVDE